MPELQPLLALRYDLDVVGALGDVVAPPYDVIDAEQRAQLAARSPYNVVRVDLPEGEPDPYAAAAGEIARWKEQGALAQEDDPALWIVSQDYEAPGGGRRTRQGVLGRIRVEEYGPGRIRPHERTHPGPREDRLKLTRATRTNLSPIFVLYSDGSSAAREAIDEAIAADAWAQVTDDDGTVHTLWRVDDADLAGRVQAAVGSSELLIADGHHRYETARVYADEIGGEGPHRYVLACLVALEDPGLTVFPTHRLAKDIAAHHPERLAETIKRDWDLKELASTDELEPPAGAGADGRIVIGYMDSYFKRPFRLTLKDPAIADAALPDRSEPYRRLDTAVVETLLLKDGLEKTDDDISHLRGLGYSRSTPEAIALVESGAYDVGFFMGAVPVHRVQEVAETGESMPPKSTYFYPKVITGLVFNPLDVGP